MNSAVRFGRNVERKQRQALPAIDQSRLHVTSLIEARAGEYQLKTNHNHK